MVRLLRLGAVLVTTSSAVRLDDDGESIASEDVARAPPCGCDCDPENLVLDSKKAAAKDAADKAADSAKFISELAKTASAASMAANQRVADARTKVEEENSNSKVEKDSLTSHARELGDELKEVSKDKLKVMDLEASERKKKGAAESAKSGLSTTEALANEELEKTSEDCLTATDNAEQALGQSTREETKAANAAQRAELAVADKVKDAETASMKACTSRAIMREAKEKAAEKTNEIQKDLANTETKLAKEVKDGEVEEEKANKEATQAVSEEAEARNEEVAVREQHAKDLMDTADRLKGEATKEKKVATQAKVKADEAVETAKSTCAKLADQASNEKVALEKANKDVKEKKAEAAKEADQKANAKVADAAKRLAAAEKVVATQLEAKEKVQKNIEDAECKAKEEAEVKSKEAQSKIREGLGSAMKAKADAQKAMAVAEKEAEEAHGAG